ncbi:Osmolarity sensor protein EnvZ [Rhodobacteraceae bacterium THAF1]|uniref:ATP-binding protein n=1 Tax=Palleronia sp. THAF1 TaxID=2587842 RepID=UPI000F3B742F|nr:ATP-binding protein [Palleronia sp. THAF1]QFU08852.1 Osmolarity sensor protein EnvZ [Palleronia sp. THAF1]VDC24436.1 Osmolarity sensor protein EnvZ [Rhodobacteraceae bacterium THAF1]
MTFEPMKRYVPRSLYGRAALILLLPVVTLQLVVGVVFVQRLFEDVTRQMTGNVAYELRYVLDQVAGEADADSARATLEALSDTFALTARLPDPAPITQDSRLIYDLSGRLVLPTLREEIEGIDGIDLASDDNRVALTVATRHGPLRLGFARNRVSASNPHQLLVIMVFTALLMTLVSYLFLKNQLRPIKRLAQAATAFGRGRSEPYSPGGASEVRMAGSAFLDMRARIERQIEQRTMMLSGISHDLRTPLTRMNLGLEMIDDPEARALQGDVAEMRRMVDAFLDFAREGSVGLPQDTDAATLLRTVVENARRSGGEVEAGVCPDTAIAIIQPVAVTRALENLVMNALRYGTRARVSLHTFDRALVFSVEDDGPGIPEAERDQAMRAFSRLDDARNQDHGGGVGLGLAIAQDVARQHGGVLRLDTSEMGGLRADLVLGR